MYYVCCFNTIFKLENTRKCIKKTKNSLYEAVDNKNYFISFVKLGMQSFMKTNLIPRCIIGKFTTFVTFVTKNPLISITMKAKLKWYYINHQNHLEPKSSANIEARFGKVKTLPSIVDTSHQ